ncbi:MAG TPA: A/G-specific adenine glycosylase [Chthonomonadaceae bacterium]|nr:A/G-specific adenine glycosylase [Chthonomonadaceae bacterium]
MSALLEVALETKERIAARLLEWYRVHKRDLPWRGASPYAVWVSEIMLQQTQVATVIPFFRRFLERFPTVEVLAEAPIEEVLKYWAGLGYYARARNLHRAAQVVVTVFGGSVPNTPEAIETLPGIGRYTAGAILSIAYNVPRPLVDANVVRVLSRVFGLHGDPKSAANQAALWSLAEQLVPETAPGDFNQGLMELGALLCEPSDPKCERCPLLADCVAGNSPDPSALPELPPGRATVQVTHSAALIRNEAGQVLIVQRPLHGLWGGLWEFPRVVCASAETPQEAAVRAAREIVGLEVELGKRVGKIKHAVTHHRITLYCFSARLRKSDAAPQQRDCAAVRWEPPDALDDYAFSSPQALLRSALHEFLTREIKGDIQPSLSFEE